MKRLLNYSAYPAIIALSFAAYAAVRHAQIPGGIAVFLATVINMILIACVEIVIPLRRKWSPFKDWQSVNDIMHAIFATEVAVRLPKWALAASATVFATMLGGYGAGAFWPSTWPWAGQFLLVLIISEIIFYWLHRAFHTGILWRFHALHHNADKMNVLKSGRLHAGEIVVRHFFLNLPFVLLGVDADLVFAVAIWTNVFGNLAHANIHVILFDWLHGILVTPSVHHLHHERDLTLGNSNFSNTLAFIDRIFASYKKPFEHAFRTPGIREDFFPRNWFGQLIAPFVPNSFFGKRAVPVEVPDEN